MSDEFVVAVQGLSQFRGVADIPAAVKRDAYRAVNYAAKRGRTESAKRMREQVNFPAQYLSGQDGRLAINMASADNLEARISTQFRPTSLARFVKGNPKPWKSGVSLEVDPGVVKRSNRMFVVPLRRGTQLTETVRNLGLAIRLKPGESIDSKYKMAKLDKGLYLLFGPSVSQVFYTVADDVAPDVQRWMEDEFLRLIKADLQ